VMLVWRAAILLMRGIWRRVADVGKSQRNNCVGEFQLSQL
jgi:hypothetical protein